MVDLIRYSLAEQGARPAVGTQRTQMEQRAAMVSLPHLQEMDLVARQQEAEGQVVQ